MGRSHLAYLARTVLVRNNDVDVAYKHLERVLNQEKILQKVAYNRYYEKPYLTRGRLSWERCKRIYNSEMSRKLQFISRKNRVDPWPR
ncbi:hypothetical protein LSH36_20g06038 [Paralvinella palmiformis]|uniref:28S ribosomal protein S21, mitochondrial n=1 Tax=Paralvinella palmiformis TaxID=53620 RepID=A0AAD9KCT5_9ANNE|nr:hypothetical protein LSH36_20g06038 [Paralvinella palmiformis]